MLRNAMDLAPLLCGHYLGIGFDKLVFIDDGSSDGTFEFLSAVSKHSPRVQVGQVASDVYSQRQTMTDAVNDAIASGFNIVFPFDADEFWNIDAARIRSAALSPGLFVANWVQFVQHRSQRCNSTTAALKVRFRAPAFDDTGPETVSAYTRSFVNLVVPKVAVVADGPLELAKGQHALVSGPTDVLAGDLELFHLPLRSADELGLRAVRAGRELAEARQGEAWQSRFFRAAAAEGRLADVWAANSASADGFLDLPAGRMMLIRDERLGRLLRAAYWFMLARFPWQMALFFRRSGL